MEGIVFPVLCLILTLQFYSATADDTPSGRGNYTFTGFFSLHSSDGTAAQKCGEIDTQNAIIFLEAFRYAVNFVNNLNLTRYKMGYQVADTCDSTLELKKVIKTQCIYQYDNRMVAVVGPSTSDAALEMSHVFNVWGISTLSYAAGSPIFDDRQKHEKILRTIPSESYQIEALRDVIRHFNWTYIATIASCSNYEQQVVSNFDKLMRDDRRCLARKAHLPCIRTAANYENVLQLILKDSKVRVVVMFTRKDDTIGILQAAKRLNLSPGRFVWLGSTSWGNLDLKTPGLERVASGALSLIDKFINVTEDFKKHFFSLNPQNNNYTSFIEYWEAIFNCSTSLVTNKHKRSPCTGKEKLEEGKGWHLFSNPQPVFDATLAAYRGFYREMPFCPYLEITPKICQPHALLEGMKIVNRIQEAPFKSIPSSRIVEFGPRGGVIGQYDILNFAPNNTGYAYKMVGSWEAVNNVTTKGTLSISNGLIFWPDQVGNGPPVSVCSEPCQRLKGEIQIPDKAESLALCCWTCQKCAKNEKIVNETCVACGEREMPDRNRDSCLMLPERTVKYTDTKGAVILTFSIIGFLGTTFTVIFFVYFYSSPVVKASGRESSFLMLVGIYLCFIASLIFLAPPSTIICGIERFIAGLSFCVIYAPLFLKTNRIFRIFQSAKTTTARPSLISPLSQTLISLGIISIQIMLGIVWIIGDPPRVKVVFPASGSDYIVFCRSDPYTMILNLFICLVIMLACTWYAFRTRHFPKNYNETKSIMYTLYFSCFAWGVFLPTYLLSNDEESFFRTYTLAIFCDVIGFISLSGFFGPKVHLLFRKTTVNDSAVTGTMMLSNVDRATHIDRTAMKTEDVRQIVVEEQLEEQQQEFNDTISNKSVANNSLANASIQTTTTNVSVRNGNVSC